MKTLLSISSAAAFVVLALITTSCTSMTKKDCETANWSSIGREDGEQGRPLKEFETMQKQCEAYSQAPNRDAYLASYKEGLVKYCTQRNGEILGRTGSQYFEQCPEEMKSDFLKGYRYGLSQFKVQMNRDRFEAYRLQTEDQLRDKSTSIQQ